MTQSQSLGTIRILHLEDDPRDAALLRRQLERAGFTPEVTIVADQLEFLKALRSKPFDIILTDYSLPTWSGLGALELLHQEGCEIPCILVSGTTGEEPRSIVLRKERALREESPANRRKQIEQSRDRLALIGRNVGRHHRWFCSGGPHPELESGCVADFRPFKRRNSR